MKFKGEITNTHKNALRYMDMKDGLATYIYQLLKIKGMILIFLN